MATRQLVGTRVLLVEDETLVAMNLEDALTELGCEVVGPAARLDAAAEMIGHERFDCALIDVDLRGRPAYPLAELLDQRGVPFCFVTGYEPGVSAQFRRSHPVLAKPVNPAKLKAALLRVARPRPKDALPRRKR